MNDTSISPDLVKTLRQQTNAGVLACKKALEACDGDLAAAVQYLRKQGIIKGGEKAHREAKEGLISSYIHLQGRIGVMLEVNCETDFVAKTPVFKEFVKELGLHITAAQPTYISREDIPAEVIASEEEIQRAQVRPGTSEELAKKVVAGRMGKFFTENCLLDQAYMRDSHITIGELVKAKIAELGENIVIKRFVCYRLGE